MIDAWRRAGGLALTVAACAAVHPQELPVAPPAPDPPQRELSRALRAIHEGRTDEAFAILEPLEREYPNSAKLQHHLGLAYDGERRYELAGQRFHRALELDPRLHDARAPYGWSLYYLGRLEQARAMFESRLAAVPTDAGAHLALGLIELDGDRIDAARVCFLQAIELTRAGKDGTTEALARARLADVELRAGQLETARRLLVVAIELDPQNGSYYFKLSRVLQRIGDTDGALRVLALRERVLAGDREAE